MSAAVSIALCAGAGLTISAILAAIAVALNWRIVLHSRRGRRRRAVLTAIILIVNPASVCAFSGQQLCWQCRCCCYAGLGPCQLASEIDRSIDQSTNQIGDLVDSQASDDEGNSWKRAKALGLQNRR
jgi:hypothetical protein